MKISGILTGGINYSYIYLINYDRYIYIGETGNHPALRWGSHLTKNGSFISNLNKLEGISIRNDEDIFFISIRCNEVEKENIYKRRIARRAIEAELHRSYVLDPRVFGPDSKLISSPPQDPTRQVFSFDPCSIAKEIYEIITQRYEKWANEKKNFFE
jgi:hypothetical protein